MHENHTNTLSSLQRSHGLRFGPNRSQLLLQCFIGMPYLCAEDCTVPWIWSSYSLINVCYTGWEDVVIAELKVTGGLLIEPEFCTSLMKQKVKRARSMWKTQPQPQEVPPRLLRLDSPTWQGKLFYTASERECYGQYGWAASPFIRLSSVLRRNFNQIFN